jgi:site-specific DNA-methyltransferase (adenine-specific)
MIINEDCIKILPTIEDESIDLIAIDPPYEIGYDNNEWDKQSLDWEFLSQEFLRILKPTGNLLIFQGWSNVSRTKDVLDSNFILNNWIVWDRIKGRGAKTNFVSTREDILWYTKTKKYTFNKIYSNIKKKTGGMGTKNGQPNRALSNVWYDISPIVPWSKERVKHPTQKPVQLMERIVTIFSNENDTVLDCFAGSGSTIIAAKRLNRQFIGIERDIDYYNIINERLSNELQITNTDLSESQKISKSE